MLTPQERADRANDILMQLGGNRFKLMTGARFFLSTADGLRFKVPSKKANCVMIALKPDDTYTMTFLMVRGMHSRTVKEVQGVYNSQLARVFTEVTGLETRL